MTHTLFAWVAAHGSLALFGLLVLGIVGVPVPDETLLVIAGVLVDQARLDAVPTYTAAFLGSALGITVSYLLGRSAGVTIIHRYGHRLGIASKEVAEVRAVFQRGGRWVLMLGYFVPGIRHLTALVAGAAGLPFGRFAVFAYSGAALWSAIFITLGLSLGDRWEEVTAQIETHTRTVALISLVVTTVFVIVWWRRRTTGVPPSNGAS